jgi:hypothetical protein
MAENDQTFEGQEVQEGDISGIQVRLHGSYVTVSFNTATTSCLVDEKFVCRLAKQPWTTPR